MIIRPASASDRAAIFDLTTSAFDGHPHSDFSEPRIVDALRDAGALSLSIVAEIDGTLVGHAAFSAVDWPGEGDWFGLGPVSVAPERQGQGIGRAVIEAGLGELRRRGARGCLVLGDPAYYGRFGFSQDARLTYPGLPSEFFMALAFGPIEGEGPVRYHKAFG